MNRQTDLPEAVAGQEAAPVAHDVMARENEAAQVVAVARENSAVREEEASQVVFRESDVTGLTVALTTAQHKARAVMLVDKMLTEAMEREDERVREELGAMFNEIWAEFRSWCSIDLADLLVKEARSTDRVLRKRLAEKAKP